MFAPVSVDLGSVRSTQTMVTREIAPMNAAVVTLGSIAGGTAGNVVADEVRLLGTVRAYEEADRAYLHAQWRRNNPLPYKSVHTLLDGVQGQGQYVGHYVAWGAHNSGRWGAGECEVPRAGRGDWPPDGGPGPEAPLRRARVRGDRFRRIRALRVERQGALAHPSHE